MKYRYSILIIGVIFWAHSFGQTDSPGNWPMPNKREFIMADQHAKGIHFTGSIDSMAQAFSSLKNPFLITRSIYSWICYNIEYDFGNMNNPTKLALTPIAVLHKKSTVCAGYSALFEELCIRNQIECHVILGWAKNDLADLYSIDTPNHAWNAVKINELWWYFDCTWGSGYSEEKYIRGIGKVKKFRRSWTSAYCLMTPNQIALEHFPEDAEWQKLNPISQQEFEDLPLFFRAYFTMWISDLNRQNKIIHKRRINLPKRICFTTPFPINRIQIENTNLMCWYRKGNKCVIWFKPKKQGIATVFVNNKAILAYIIK
jgi:hypothetical protein